MFVRPSVRHTRISEKLAKFEQNSTRNMKLCHQNHNPETSTYAGRSQERIRCLNSVRLVLSSSITMMIWIVRWSARPTRVIYALILNSNQKSKIYDNNCDIRRVLVNCPRTCISIVSCSYFVQIQLRDPISQRSYSWVTDGRTDGRINPPKEMRERI